MCGAAGKVGGHWPSELYELVRWNQACRRVTSSSRASCSLFRTRSCHGRKRRAMGVSAQVEARPPCHVESSSKAISSRFGARRQASSKVQKEPRCRQAETRSMSFCREAGVCSKVLSGLFSYFRRNQPLVPTYSASSAKMISAPSGSPGVLLRNSYRSGPCISSSIALHAHEVAHAELRDAIGAQEHAELVLAQPGELVERESGWPAPCREDRI